MTAFRIRRAERPSSPGLGTAGRLRARWRRVAARPDAGAATAELVIAMPLLLFLVMAVIQAGVWMHATHVAQAGKDGRIRVIDLQAATGSAPHRGGESQSVGTPGGSAMFTAMAVYRHNGTVLLIAADGGGTAAWTYAAGSLTPAWNNGNPGTSPVVAGGLLFVYDARSSVRVYDPATGNLVGSLNCGGGHWNSPIVADGRVALAEGSANSHNTSGVLDIWRLP